MKKQLEWNIILNQPNCADNYIENNYYVYGVAFVSSINNTKLF